MKELRFGGYSDDTFFCSGPGMDVDFDTCASMKPVSMRVEAEGESLFVVGQYAPDSIEGGCWLIGVAPDDAHDDETPIPQWPMRFARSDRPYSPSLVIEAPDSVTVTLFRHGKAAIERD